MRAVQPGYVSLFLKYNYTAHPNSLMERDFFGQQRTVIGGGRRGGRTNILSLRAQTVSGTQRHSLLPFIEVSQDTPPKFVALRCFKFGEHPPFGPPIPSRLISLIGPDRELFLKGRRCENQALGIGAFVYYRRVVEDQKNRIFDEIIKVAEMVSAPPDTIAKLREAKKENQFSKAIDMIKDAIPQRLLIHGQNPLTLLHSALSRGLHEQTDEKCLELATDIRLILAELSELLGHALKDERELKEAISRLMRQSSTSA